MQGKVMLVITPSEAVIQNIKDFFKIAVHYLPDQSRVHIYLTNFIWVVMMVVCMTSDDECS
jgi:hypothetical protein